MSVYFSWGVSKKYYLEFKDMPALMLQVNGFNYKGKVIIALNGGKDAYEIYTQRNGEWIQECDEAYCDNLGEILDRIIETSNDQSDEYKEKVNKWVDSIGGKETA